MQYCLRIYTKMLSYARYKIHQFKPTPGFLEITTNVWNAMQFGARSHERWSHSVCYQRRDLREAQMYCQCPKMFSRRIFWTCLRLWLRSTPLLDTYLQTSPSTSPRGNPRCHFEVRSTSWSLHGQTLDPSILTEGTSLLHMHTSGRSIDHNAIMTSLQIYLNL